MKLERHRGGVYVFSKSGRMSETKFTHGIYPAHGIGNYSLAPAAGRVPGPYYAGRSGQQRSGNHQFLGARRSPTGLPGKRISGSFKNPRKTSGRNTLRENV